MSHNAATVIQGHDAFEFVIAIVQPEETQRHPNGDTTVHLRVQAKLNEPSPDDPEQLVANFTATATPHACTEHVASVEDLPNPRDCIGPVLSGAGPFTSDHPPKFTTSREGRDGPPSGRSRYGNIDFSFSNVVFGAGMAGCYVFVVEISEKNEGVKAKFISNPFNI